MRQGSFRLQAPACYSGAPILECEGLRTELLDTLRLLRELDVGFAGFMETRVYGEDLSWRLYLDPWP